MISIVIPLYNKAHTITRTLSTVLTQTFQNFEIVIVNDGSKDKSVEVIRQFTSDYRIRIIHQKNLGVSVARNRGVSESKFEYIAFLDGDDEWLPEYLSTMKKAIDKFPNAGMFCCAGKVRNNTGIYERLAKKYENKITMIRYFENPHVYTHTSATVVSKKAFNMTQGFPPGMRLNQDYALFFSIALIAPVVYCGHMLSIYVGDVKGQTTQRSQDKSFHKMKHITNRINLCHTNWKNTNKKDKIFPIFEKYEIRAILLGFLKNKYYDSINYFFDSIEPSIFELSLFFEPLLYKSKHLNKLSIMYIYFTKIMWRLRNYPRINYSKPENN
jgi:glycosyltransferase involved in cell wall biosynthesis